MTNVTETPAAPVAAPATPAAPAEPAKSIVTQADPVSLVDGATAPAAVADPATPVADPATPAAPDPTKWYWAEGVEGKGDMPKWYKADKYKTVEAQAKAYPELEKRMGAFTGAPEDGVYKINIPEGFVGEFDNEHPLFQELNTFAKNSQMSQKAYDQVIGMLSRYEASQLPDMNDVKKQVGDNADQRIGSVNQWAKSNLSDELYGNFREALTQPNAAKVFKAIEAVIAKTKAPAMPRVDSDVAGAMQGGLEAIKALHRQKNERGELLYNVDSTHRAKVEKAYQDYEAARKAAA